MNDRQSVTGYVFALAGVAIGWSSKKQSTVALLSTEAKYMAATATMKEAIWLWTLFHKLDAISLNLMTLQIDNQSAISLVKNAVFHDHTKHIPIHHHFIRKKIKSKEITVEYILTMDQVADMLTKGLTREEHTCFAKDMGIIL